MTKLVRRKKRAKMMDAEFHGRQASDDLLAEIKSKYPRHEVYFVKPDDVITADLRIDRIRVYLDADGCVSEPLREG